MVSALVLIGAPGWGKSSVLDELGTLLQLDRVGFGAIESEHLAQGWPVLPASAWVPQLEVVLALQRDAGRTLFLVAATTETPQELEAVLGVVAADSVCVVCLAAPPDVVAARVDQREPDSWPGKAALVAHARDLAGRMPAFERVDAVMSTEGELASDVAMKVRGLMRGQGILK